MKEKTLIFHLGTSAGFYSEYLEMLASIIYCQTKNIKFKLYSKDANFSTNSGWIDYFEPFCEEVDDAFHSKYNLRFKYPSLSKLTIRKILKNKPIPKWCWSKLSFWYFSIFATSFYFKKRYNFTYYTHDLWPQIQKLKLKNSFNIEYKNKMQQVINNTWKFKDSTNTEINEIITKLNLPNEYIATQIRAGDKEFEQKIFEIDDYMKKINSINCNTNNLFVLTDDYRIIEKIKSNYPTYEIYTLCSKNEKGYDNQSFQQQTPQNKRAQLLNLFSSVEILWNSKYLIGAINANPSLFLYYRNHKNSYWINV